jgi:aminopeptidase N
VARLAGMSLGEAQIQRLAYLSVADLDPVVRKGWQFLSNNAYGGITYGKTASLLLTLEGIIGEDTLARAMHIYFMRYRFTHPTGADFLRTLNEVSGQDLTWYFSQAVTGTRILDYRVLSCASDPVDEGRASKKDKLYADTVVIQRKGDFVFPVDIEIRFEDGSRRREHWDGADRWVRYTYEKHARIDSVEVDPEHRILLLRNRFGASWTRAAHRAPVLKLANLWSFAQQCFAQALAWWLV